MNQTLHTCRLNQRLAHLPRYFWLLLSVLFLCSALRSEALAQNVQYTNEAVDLGLRSIRTVNPSTRGVELQIPLGHYRGRGGLDVPVTLSYSSKVWTVEFQGYNTGAPPPHQPEAFTIVTAEYAKHSVAGWTSAIGMPILIFNQGTESTTRAAVQMSAEIAQPAVILLIE